MKKRYVVFVSSTYTDLVEERQAVSRALLRSNCFPSQMENWPAMDAEQVIAIKQLIDECDYYLVVTAGKYGSTEKRSGISYTEIEYDYAVSIGKPIIRLLHRDPFNELRGDQIESSQKARRQLESFRTKLKTGSVCSFWRSADDLMLETTLALHDVISRHPSDGWVRSKTVEVAQEQQRESALIAELIKNVRQQNLDLGSALVDLPVPILRLSTSGEIQEYNEAARVLIGTKLCKKVHMGDLMEGLGRTVEGWMNETFASRDTSESEFLRLTREDREVFVQVTLSAIKEEEHLGLIAVLNDVTELKSLEAQFIESQKMQAIAKLAGGIAHDFNNVLTAISGHCDLLLLRHDQGDPDFSDLVQINQNANRAAAMVGQLLAFSRRQTLRPETLDLRDTIADLTHLLNRLVGERVALTLSYDPVLKPIRADKRQMEQVLMNLVVNARDAMRSGGEIRISTELTTLPKPLHRDQASVPAGEYVRIEVEDHGVGIPTDKLQKVFEPFFTTKRTGEGTGMGLSTVYGIVKQTGGYIFVDSTVGVGSKFILYFPALNSNDISKPPPVTRTTLPHSVRSDAVILLAEDDASVRAFASRSLKLTGMDVLEADCGEAALEILSDKKLRIDAIVSNVVMPGMDGPTWVIEALKDRAETPVIFISGYAYDVFENSKETIPNSVFLPKPFSFQDLVSTVLSRLETASRD